MNHLIEMSQSFIQQYGWKQSEIKTLFFAMKLPLLFLCFGVGVVLCFFGRQLYRLFGSVSGFLLGGILGCFIVVVFGMVDRIALGVICGTGIVLAFLGGWFKRVGGMLTMFLFLGSSILLVTGVLEGKSGIMIWIGIGLILILGVGICVFPDMLWMFGTALAGGGMIAGALMYLCLSLGFFPGEGFLVLGKWICVGVLAMIGFWTQLILQSRKIGKKEEAISKQIKEEESREREIEEARRILEDEDFDED